MAKKPNIKTITSGYAATTALNGNFEALRDALDNTVSRDGSVPNSMSADLDMNGNDILNANNVVTDVAIGTVSTLPEGSIATASSSQSGNTVTFNLGIPVGATGATGPAGADGTGAGDLISTNNLSDLDNASTARTNLGLGTGDSPTFVNVNVTGTVDGRDIAADGTKLDGIEAGATADQTAAEIMTAIQTVDGSGSGLDADTLDGVEGSSFVRNDSTGNLTVGYTSTADNDGTLSSGSYTPDPTTGNMKYLTNNGAFTFNAPTATGDYTLIIQVTNGAIPGAITFTNFTTYDDADITTTSGDDFFIYIVKLNGFTSARVEALQ